MQSVKLITIKEFKRINFDVLKNIKRVGIAVSGGSDSILLAYLINFPNAQVYPWCKGYTFINYSFIDS